MGVIGLLALLVELLEGKPTLFSKEDLSAYINKCRVKLMQWSRSLPGSDASVCLTKCVTECIASSSSGAFCESDLS